MGLPLILISGQAGSGKDAVATSLKRHNVASIALADPMKRFALAIFDFTEDQLWGPSEARNALDTRFASQEHCDKAMALLMKMGTKWIDHWMPGLGMADQAEAVNALRAWAHAILSQAVTEGGMSARKMLQTLGTEWGRAVSRDVWINYGIRTALKLLSGGHTYNREYGLIQEDAATGGPSAVAITDGRFRNEVIAVKAIGGQVWRVHGSDGAAAEAAGIKGHRSETEQRGLPAHFFDVHLINNKLKGLKKLDLMVDDVYRDRIEHGSTYAMVYFYANAQWAESLCTSFYLNKYGKL